MLRRWQRQFRYILVDEFQDANVAQIELIELLGRTPDRPDNVMVVGDDDQSIYRFRGASYAAFAEFDVRFAGPPARLRIDQNFRSVGHVIEAANRLIGRNETRFEPDKRLWTDKDPGVPVELHRCAGTEDEAVAIVDAIKALAGEGSGRRWNDVAVLYRKHKHRDAIVARLRDEDIPYTVVGGLSLFEAPEIRDLEQGLRAIADPHDDAALVRMMTAGPWRLDALEILRVTRDATTSTARTSWCRRLACRSRARRTWTGSRQAPPRSCGPGCAPCWPPSRSSTRSPGARARTPSWSATSSGPAWSWTSWRPAPWRPSAPSSTSRASCASRPTGRPRTRRGPWRTSSPTSTPTRPPAASCRPAWSCPRTSTASAS